VTRLADKIIYRLPPDKEDVKGKEVVLGHDGRIIRPVQAHEDASGRFHRPCPHLLPPRCVVMLDEDADLKLAKQRRINCIVQIIEKKQIADEERITSEGRPPRGENPRQPPEGHPAHPHRRKEVGVHPFASLPVQQADRRLIGRGVAAKEEINEIVMMQIDVLPPKGEIKAAAVFKFHPDSRLVPGDVGTDLPAGRHSIYQQGDVKQQPQQYSRLLVL